MEVSDNFVRDWLLTSAGLTDAANDVRTSNVDLNTVAEALPAVQIFRPLTYSLPMV